MEDSRWRACQQAWKRVGRFYTASPGRAVGGEAAVDALRDVHLIREVLAQAEVVAVRSARGAGRPWTEIAAAADITRQAAWERWRDLDPTQPEVPADGHQPREAPMPTIDDVWTRISARAGEVFHQKRGAAFTYNVYGGCVRPDRTNRQIPRSDVGAALQLVPTPTTVPLQHLQGPSYIWAILHDPRIRQDDW